MKTLQKIPVSALDVFRMLPKGTRCEVLNNTLYMSPSPVFNHQQILGELYLKIGNHTATNRSGVVVIAPFDVYLEEQMSAVQPDLIFISNRNKKIIGDDGYAHSAPDVIIEILSKDEDRDRKLKKVIYEKAGVKEYFIGDPRTKLVEAFVLKNRKYNTVYSKKKLFRSALLKLEFSF
jgi:Uma2 family endonuclease